jgi:hypothetical protein
MRSPQSPARNAAAAIMTMNVDGSPCRPCMAGALVRVCRRTDPRAGLVKVGYFQLNGQSPYCAVQNDLHMRLECPYAEPATSSFVLSSLHEQLHSRRTYRYHHRHAARRDGRRCRHYPRRLLRSPYLPWAMTEPGPLVKADFAISLMKSASSSRGGTQRCACSRGRRVCRCS